MPPLGHRQPLGLRLWSKVHKTSGCWLWQGGLNSKGYGYFWHEGRTRQAYRHIYELLRGPLPPRSELHHTCENRACVNPAHLQVVSRSQHVRVHPGPFGDNARKTHCKRGHPLTPNNLYARPSGVRDCKTCSLERTRRYRRLKKEASIAV